MIIAKTDARSEEIILNALLEKKIVIIPTDTVYGFSGIVPDTEHMLRRIKGRGEEKPFIRLIGNPEDIFLYAENAVPEKLCTLWPGALSIIVRLKNSAGKAAFRCPGDSWLRRILNGCRCPVYSTSVNRSGFPVLSSVEEIAQEFGDDAAVIVDDGDKTGALPSTIIDISEKTMRVVRQGSVAIDFRDFE